MALDQQQRDTLREHCNEIRDICGRLVERGGELSMTELTELAEIRQKLRNLKGSLRW
jgi:hypothetical protein